MNCYLFDIDDTLHKWVNKKDMYNIDYDEELHKLIINTNAINYVYTNATYGHANMILNKYNIHRQFQKIYSRDNLPSSKPDDKSAKIVEKDIKQNNIQKIFFFDDLLENLYTGKQNKWITIWISDNYQFKDNYNFVDYAFPDIKTSLHYFNNK